MKLYIRKAGLALRYDSLKDEQIAALCAFVGGRDVFVSLPTGYGWSLHVLSVVVVVSPLIALMEDHVASYSAKGLRV